MKILASGMSGTIGAALLPALRGAGHGVVRLKTGAAAINRENEIRWDPYAALDPSAVEGFDAAIHLAGQNIFGRWTEAKKKAIRESRVAGTRNLCQALAAASQKPGVLISASAIGYYGNRGDEFLDEQSPNGTGFLAETCAAWESATQPAVAAGIRVVNLRIGIVLSTDGGALSKMLTPFRLGLGGKLASGKQWMSWVHVSDLAGAVLHCLENTAVRGPVNMTAPDPVTNLEFTKTLGLVLHRPTIAAVPGFALRLLLGREMAEETVLSSARVAPKNLIASGYSFLHPGLVDALRSLLQ